MSSRSSTVVGSRPAPTTSVGTGGSDIDICPVCKTTRYLNKEMVFLINPECYHPMCSSCVGRLFVGPNHCPYAGCGKTLRKKDFRSAYFGDLAVEREVDLRRRVAAVFNQVEDDFESLDAYNEYLEKVESLTMDLVNGDPAQRRQAEADLSRWELDHRADIDRNRRRGERDRREATERLRAETDAVRVRRLEAFKQDQEEKARRAAEREEDLELLARAPEGAAGKVMLRRRGERRGQDLAAEEEAALRRAAAGASGSLSIRGLKDKRRKEGAVEGPYDPFGGVSLSGSRYTVRDDYPAPAYDAGRHRDNIAAGGFSMGEYFSRAMFEAFAGLGVFVGDEKEVGMGASLASVATMDAALAAGSMEIDDAFS